MRWISRIWASWRQNDFCSIDGIWDGNGNYGVSEVVLGICPCSPRIGIFKIRTHLIMDQMPMFFHACNCNSCVTSVGGIWYCLRWWCGGDPVRADRFWSSHSHGKLLRSQLLEEWGVKRPFPVTNCIQLLAMRRDNPKRHGLLKSLVGQSRFARWKAQSLWWAAFWPKRSGANADSTNLRDSSYLTWEEQRRSQPFLRVSCIWSHFGKTYSGVMYSRIQKEVPFWAGKLRLCRRSLTWERGTTAKTGLVLVMQMQLLPYWKQLHDQSRPRRAGCRHFLPWFVSYVLPNTNKIHWRMYFDESIESVLKDVMMRCFLLCDVLSHLQASCPSLDFCLLSCLVWPFPCKSGDQLMQTIFFVQAASHHYFIQPFERLKKNRTRVWRFLPLWLITLITKITLIMINLPLPLFPRVPAVVFLRHLDAGVAQPRMIHNEVEDNFMDDKGWIELGSWCKQSRHSLWKKRFVKNIDLLNVDHWRMIPEFCFMSVIFNMKDDMDGKFGSGALCTIGTRYGKGAKSCGVKWRGGKDQNLPILDKFQHCWQNSTAMNKWETPGLTSQALTLHALAFVFPCPLKSLVDFLWFVT